MSVSPSPTVAQWELNTRLRRRRRQLGIEVSRITEAVGINRNNWSAMENDRRIIPERHLRDLAELFELDPDELAELLELRAAAKQTGWWSGYGAAIPDDQRRFYGMEYGAESIRVFANLVLPELLQTEDYARALISANIFVPQAAVDRAVQVRLLRQRRLTDSNPVRLTAVVSEAALRQSVAGPDTQRTQLKRLDELVREHPNTVDIRVLPFTSAAAILNASALSLLDFAGSHLPTLGWHESANFRGFIDDARDVSDLQSAFGEAYDRSQPLRERV